jgi:hypothetical protein
MTTKILNILKLSTNNKKTLIISINVDKIFVNKIVESKNIFLIFLFLSVCFE